MKQVEKKVDLSEGGACETPRVGKLRELVAKANVELLGEEKSQEYANELTGKN